jgi:two-component system, sporulation sensor kinase D
MGSLIYTENLVSKLKVEERENVELWAEATRLISLSDTSQNIEFLSSIIDRNNTVPVILTDESDSIISTRNFDNERTNEPGYLIMNLEKIKGLNKQ